MGERTKEIAGFVLAGGASSRMGRPKALLEIGGEPMLVRTARLLESVTGSATVIGTFDGCEELPLPFLKDEWPGTGPLGAIATVLRKSSAPWNLIVGTDLPYLTREWLEYVVERATASQADAVVPMNLRGAEPMCAAYHKCAEALLLTTIEHGTRKVTDGLKSLSIEWMEPSEWKRFDSAGVLFKNMNTPEDYEEAKAALEGRADSR